VIYYNKESSMSIKKSKGEMMKWRWWGVLCWGLFCVFFFLLFFFLLLLFFILSAPGYKVGMQQVYGKEYRSKD